MLLFRSEEDIEAWRQANSMPMGQILTLEQVWALSVAWYSDRLSSDYKGRTAQQAEAIFKQVGLESPFWHLIPDQ